MQDYQQSIQAVIAIIENQKQTATVAQVRAYYKEEVTIIHNRLREITHLAFLKSDPSSLTIEQYGEYLHKKFNGSYRIAADITDNQKQDIRRLRWKKAFQEAKKDIVDRKQAHVKAVTVAFEQLITGDFAPLFNRRYPKAEDRKTGSFVVSIMHCYRALKRYMKVKV